MGRRKNNPKLVEELIDGRWEMDQDEFEEKWNLLSLSDKYEVEEAIDNMENEWSENDDYDEDFELANFCNGGDLTED